MSEETATLERYAPTEETTEIALVDLSSIAYPTWHVSGQEPDQDYVSRQIVARVRSLTRNHPKAAICCDSGKSFRHQITPEYKAQREASPAALHHQIRLAKETLAADGYPVWAVKDFEADDLIATAVSIALGLADTTVLIMSGDKDLLQLVGPRVRVMQVKDGTIYDEAGVFAKFAVRPDQVKDYLTLVGDKADNIKGANGIGAVKAADLLGRFGSLSGIYKNLSEHGTQFKPAMATALREFQGRMMETQLLITLRTDVEIPFAELDNDRASRYTPMEAIDMSMMTEAADQEVDSTNEAAAVVDMTPIAEALQAAIDASAPAAAPAPAPEAPKPAAEPAKEAAPVAAAPKPSTAIAVREAEVLPAVEYEKQLEPRSMTQAITLANHFFNTRLFAAYGTPQAILSTVMAGRELGLPAVASLRGFHIVEGKHQMHADLIRALVLKSGLVDYFRCTERTPERATFIAKRKGDPEIALSYTVEEARAAGLVKEKSGWVKNPADMCVARASSKLARLVAPEIVFGLYAPEEFD